MKSKEKIFKITARHHCGIVELFAALMVFASLVFLAGCNFAPPYKTPAVETPAGFKETNGWKLADPKDDAIRGKWWEAFNDSQLNAYESQVTVSNQNLAAAFANFMAARAVVKEARSQYFPVVSLDPSATKTHQPSSVLNSSAGIGRSQTTSLYSVPLDASWQPDLWGTVRNTVKADVYNAQASAATLENLRLSAQADLAVDYYELRGQDALVQVFSNTLVAYQKTFELTKTLFQSGIDSDEDVAAAETQLATAQAQASNLGILRAEYEHAIALLLGQPASTFSIAPQPFKPEPPLIPVSLPSRLLERRPDIAAAERSVAAANAQIGVARAAFFPTITLTGSAGFESTSIGNLFSGPSFAWAIGAAATQTIFDAGLRRATVEQYRAQYDSTVANYRQTVLTAFQQVEDNLAAIRILSQESQQQNLAVEGAQRTVRLSTERYRLGIDSYLNLLTAETTLLNNEQTQVNLQIQEMTASVQLILALGGGWNSSQLPPEKNITSNQATNSLQQVSK